MSAVSKPQEGEFIPAPNFVRGWWRSFIIDYAALHLGHSGASFEAVISKNRDTLGADLLEILDTMHEAERDHMDRTTEMMQYAAHRCDVIAQRYAHFQGSGHTWPHAQIAAAWESARIKGGKPGGLRYRSFAKDRLLTQ